MATEPQQGPPPAEGQREHRCLYLIDAMALAYRSHFIFISRPLINSKGQNTSASYGFTNSLLKLIEEHGMDHMAVVFDVGGDQATFRSELYDDYKANRLPAPEDLLFNLPYIKQIVRALDIPVVGEPGVEADDVIGTLARRAEREGADVVIVSPDKDFQQLLSDRITVNRPAHRGEEFDPITAASFREKFGLEPIQFIDVLALMGDASDNVPGVPGIGEKTAIQLIQTFGSVENVLAHVDEVKGKRPREGLQQHREDALLSKRLVTIKTDVPVDVDWHQFQRARADLEGLRALFAELEFHSLLRRLDEHGDVYLGPTRRSVPMIERADDFGDDPSLSFDFGPYEAVTQLDQSAVDYAVVRNRAELEALVAELARQERFAFDTETTSVDQMMASLVGLSFSWQAGQGRYVPTPLPDGTTTDEVLGVLRPVFGKPKVGQNAKYDIVVLARHGVRVEGPVFDTMVAHYLIAPEEEHNLDSLARKYLNYRTMPITALIGTGKDQRSMRDVPLDEIGPYACEDADVAWRLASILRDELEKSRLLEIAETMEFPLIYVLADMELAGVGVDVAILREISEQLEAELGRLEAEIYREAGQEFNIGSTQQLGEILFDKLKLPVVTKTSTGKPSTKESVLFELATEHALPGLILDWRKIAKLKSTYVDSLGELIHPETGRVHTDFNQTITATGRLSCLPAGTLVNTENGLVGIEAVRVGEAIRTPYGPRRVLGWQATGEKPVVRLQLSNGVVLRCSPDHRLRSLGAWVHASEMVPGSPLYMSFVEGLFGREMALSPQRTAAYPTRKSPVMPTEWSVELAELVGYCLADGHICRSNYNGKPSKFVLAFGWQEDDLIDYFATLIERIFDKKPTRRTTRTCLTLELSSVDAAGLLVQLGAGEKSGAIRVPSSLFSAPAPVVGAFLRGYFEGDGHVREGHGISARSVSRAMLEEVQQLLTLFGIPSGLHDGGADPRGYATRHTLRILGDRSKRAFAQRIGFLSARKQSQCEALASQPRQKSSAELLSLPEAFDVRTLQTALYEAHRDADGHVPQHLYVFTSKQRTKRRAMTLSRAEWIIDSINDREKVDSVLFLREAALAQYFEVSVVDVSYESPVPMYDIVVDGVEQYMAQGIVVHNSSNPNLQNIPIRTEMGREIRKAFVPTEGWKLVAADYVQIELRILASMSGDKNLRQDFLEGRDIHTATAARVFKVEPGAVTRDQRRKAKEVNYGIPYGVSAWGLAQRLRSSVKEAQALIDQYQRTYPDVSSYLVREVEAARVKGYVETLLGRRRYVPGIKSRDRTESSFYERVAVNMPIQGTQADMIKLAMVRIHDRLGREGLRSRMLLQVHDELVFEAPPEEIERLSRLVEDEMIQALPLEVPVEVDLNVGDNWLDAH